MIGPCYWVTGIISLSADRGFILGRDDKRPALVIGRGPNSAGYWPQNLERAVSHAQKQTGFLSAWVHGTYEVCPVPQDAPGLAYVCVESATRLAPENVGDRERRKSG